MSLLDLVTDERDRYKALAERRGEALERNTPVCFNQDCQAVGIWIWWGPYGNRHQCDEHKTDDRFGEKVELDDDALFARAAIDLTPEQAYEKTKTTLS